MSYTQTVSATRKALPLALTWLIVAEPIAAQVTGPTSATGAPPAYVTRGNEVENRYQAHRANLDRFYKRIVPILDSAAPELKSKLLPPADIPYGYQILPTLFPNPTQTKQGRIKLSPFSWSRTDSVITREADSLVLLENRLDKTASLDTAARRSEYASIADEYRRLVYGQRFIADLVQYNRLWQSEIARLPGPYANARRLQDAAIERQRILDSLASAQSSADPRPKLRIAMLSQILDSATRKAPAPAYVRVTHPSEHQWIVNVPLYTDITDSGFVEQVRSVIESGWHVQDNGDDFVLKLDIKRISPATLYPQGDIPAKGAHIDVPKHVDRFPKDGGVLTTGSNTTYVWGKAILIGPHGIARRVLVHEFGHLLGFQDGYFRSSRGESADGYRVVEVILDPESIVAAPEYGYVTRQHFDQLIGESTSTHR